MELRYPLLLIILLIAVAAYIYFQNSKKQEYKSGLKIANTKFIKNTSYYKEKLKKYNLLKKIITICSLISIFVSIVMIARPSKIETKNSNEYNRDIVLCMDVSGSVDSLNRELVNNLKDTVNSLKGERFGISIFDSSYVTVAPLTDDYEFINKELDNISRAFGYRDISVEHNYEQEKLEEDYYLLRGYITSGTTEGRGSSLIGDGLASCIYNFPNIDEERTRIIIFSTDNSLAGTPLVDLTTAANISKSKNIKVFGIATSDIMTKEAKEYKNAVEITGGKYYVHGENTMNNIISDIEKTSKTLLKDQIDTVKTDVPLIPFLFLLISFSVLLVLNKKVLL